MRVGEGAEARNQPVVELECRRLFLSSIEVKSSLITRMDDTPTTSTDPPDTSSAIPSHLAEQLEGAILRSYLLNKIESIVASLSAKENRGAAVCLVTGEPGSGKTFLAAQLAKALKCPAYFVRIGNADGFIWKDAKRFLVSLGLQLRARYGSEIFGPPALQIEAELNVGVVGQSGKAGGVEIAKVSLSPFQQILIDVKVNVDELAGEAFLVRVKEVTDAIDEMSVPRLAQEALLFPLEKLAQIQPEEHVKIIVDSLDDGSEITKAIPFGPELPGNVTWILTSQPGEHLDRFVDQTGATTITRFDLSEPEITDSSIDEAADYALTRLSEPSLSELLDAAPIANRPMKDLAHDLADASNGNFLYLHHLIGGIQVEARAGRFDLIRTPSALPRGLDGIYRYFLTNRIRNDEHKRDFIEFYVPVLGVLAVARAPLVSGQIADFSKLDQWKVDEVLGEVQQFLETTRVPGNLAYYIYHGSFADFLLTQDKSRNPYPLRPESFYHAAIADYYQSVTETAWSNSEDRYALMHLPTHLARAGRLDNASQLLRGPFARRQIETVGPAQTRADSIRVARAAASQNKDEVFIQMLELASRILAEIEIGWASGHYVLSLLNDDPKVLLERMGEGAAAVGFGGQMLPWSGFLLAERLLDLGASLEARDVLRMIERRAWLSYRPPKVHITGALEGSSFDFILQDDLIAFLARVAQVDPSLALGLTKRIFPDKPQLPNVRSAWREIMREFIAWRFDFGKNTGSGATPEQYLRLAETTVESLKEGDYVLGSAGITRALFKVLACSLPLPDPMWLANVILGAVGTRMAAAETTQGAIGRDENNKPDKSPGRWAALADVLTGLFEIKNASDSRQTQFDETTELADVINEIIRVTIQSLPRPPMPKIGGRTHRTAALGQLAWNLYAAGSERWQEFAEVALIACELDVGMDDPTLTAITRGLISLRRIPEETMTADVEALIAKYKLADHIKRMEKADAKNQGLDVGKQTLTELEQQSDPYRRGRIVLSLWRRKAAALAEIESGLDTAFLNTRDTPKRKTENAARPKFSDLLAEALVSALTKSTGSWLPDLVHELDQSRTPERQEQFGYEERRFQAKRLNNLAEAGEIAQVRDEALVQYQQAIASEDVNAQLGLSIQVISADPDLADRWFSELLQKLKDDSEIGKSVAWMVEQLKRRQPHRFDDLGPRWVAYLPAFENSSDLEYYELLICQIWGKLDIFRPQLISMLHHSAKSLPDPESLDDEDGWGALGTILSAAGHVRISEADESQLALHNLVMAVIEIWKKQTADAERWQIKSVSKAILQGVVEHNQTASLQSGPISDFIADFYDASREDSMDRDDTEDEFRTSRDQEIKLGLSLAIKLKQASPEWSEARFDEAHEFWDALLIREPAHGGGLTGMLENVLDGVAFMDESFRSRRERGLFELTQKLTRWCVAEPLSTETLTRMQARLNRLENTDLRSLLLAVLAEGWLKGKDWERASSLAQVVGTEALAKTQFCAELQSQAWNKFIISDSAEREALTSLVTNVLLWIQPEAGQDAFVDALSAWLTLRAGEKVIGGASALHGDNYLRDLANWAIANSREAA